VTAEGLTSEGVGSYWPFATGTKVRHANLLLELIENTPGTRYALIPNQHIGAYRVGFMGEWVVREWMARRGSLSFRPGQLLESRCALLGYTLPGLRVNGQEMPKGFLRVHEQLEVGTEGYDKGAEILRDFFLQELEQFDTPELIPLGRKIIELCRRQASVQEFWDILPQ